MKFLWIFILVPVLALWFLGSNAFAAVLLDRLAFVVMLLWLERSTRPAK